MWVAVGNIHPGDSLTFVDGPFPITTSALWSITDLNENGDLIVIDPISSEKKMGQVHRLTQTPHRISRLVSPAGKTCSHYSMIRWIQ